ncbi:peptidylprolyl isomerase [Erysipelothrix rhusiopathiae]|uniref:peptidylprolyl isomerase n=1 Tax=Erysipelothrix rhusiopathiae TaxID=1648 RepID=UPI000210B78C|nr:peptidylprolyl isomerase [Erysipelothrix rhusiopathiae]AGN23726.1 putative peptidylprolyl isomerase [Erysipelothrix rhusiopathiae SY1027]AMS11499.1 peptidylprolyl isomerase [Erysipelothrix rhusiopathiae]AOO67998.1 peptidylprolyl isomerase [Erysipelothrix rhusiopathiae]AWU41156.1 peptidylprolyl isomerase [Erysipelothrix rhusiopathiae]MCG4437121.1 peptidylprolyl isomerase [Erysipelothrix rhusiopathiae]
MKKLLVSLLALLMLAGCSDARAMISTDEEIFSVGNEKVTSKRLFDVMKLSDGGMTVVKSAQNKITENVADEDVKAEADKRLEEIKEVFGDQLEERLKQSGYESVDAFMSQTVYPELKMTHLLKEKMVTDFEALTTENAPRKARILQLENQEKADEALEKIKAGENFDDIAKDYKVTGSPYDGSAKVHLLKSVQYPQEVADALKNATEPTLSGVLSDASDDSKYIVQIIEIDASRYQDETIEAFVGSKDIVNKYLAQLFVDNGFKIYDKDVYDAVAEKFPQYLNIQKEKDAK